MISLKRDFIWRIQIDQMKSDTYNLGLKIILVK